MPVGKVHAGRAAGVELVHQSFALPPSFTVAEAMEFGARRGRLPRRALEARWAGHLKTLGVESGLRNRIRDLPVETRQAVGSPGRWSTDAKVLILDEPTAVLSPPASRRCSSGCSLLSRRGVTIVLILHKIREVLDIAETISVLRGGR